MVNFQSARNSSCKARMTNAALCNVQGFQLVRIGKGFRSGTHEVVTRFLPDMPIPFGQILRDGCEIIPETIEHSAIATIFNDSVDRRTSRIRQRSIVFPDRRNLHCGHHLVPGAIRTGGPSRLRPRRSSTGMPPLSILPVRPASRIAPQGIERAIKGSLVGRPPGTNGRHPDAGEMI